MAYTATATMTTKRDIFKRLCMDQVAIVYLLPTKTNITYIYIYIYICKTKGTLLDAITHLVHHIHQERKTAEKTIILYCRRHNEVAEVYKQVK